MKARIHNMTSEDFDYATEHLDSQLMQMFQYKHPSEIQ